jgi:hypothetical protein
VDTLRSLSIAHARLPHTFIGHYLAGARSSHACERWCVVDPKSELNAQRVVFSSPTAFTNLVQLNLSQSDVNDNNLLALSGAHNPSLHLAQVWTPGRDRLLFSHRAIGLTKLQDLNLESCCITDTGLAALARMCTPSVLFSRIGDACVLFYAIIAMVDLLLAHPRDASYEAQPGGQ